MDASPLQPRSGPAPRPRGFRLANLAWGASALLVVGVLIILSVALREETVGADVSSALVDGDRPVAPPLPTRGIADDGAPGLPSWYRPRGNGASKVSGQHVMVVNFWASWCGPCHEEAPVLQEAAERYAGRGVTIVGLNAGGEDLESGARSFVRQYKLTFPIVRGNRADKARWGVSGYPETFIVDTDGRVAGHIDGPLDESALDDLIEGVL